MTAIASRPALATLILREEPRAARNVLALAVVGGLCGTATGAIAITALTDSNAQQTILALLFAIVLVVLAVTCRALHLRAGSLAESVAVRLRQQALDRVFAAGIAAKGSEDQLRMTQQLAATPAAIAEVTGPLALAVLQATLLATWLAYLAFIDSIAAGVILCAVLLVAAWHARQWQRRGPLPRAPLSAAHGLIQRHDAARLSRMRAQDLRDSFLDASGAFDAAARSAADGGMRGALLTFASVQLLLAIALFAGHYAFGDATGLTPLPATLAVLFAALPLVALADSVTALASAERLAADWIGLLQHLAGRAEAAASDPAPFRTIRLSGVFLDPAKALGPIDLEVAAGEWLVLSGESGSGKTLLLRVLAGLDAPLAGTASVDGVPLADRERAALRGRVAAVLPDSTPPELPAADREIADAEVAAVLVALHLDPARFLRDGRFRIEGASSGEAARLAFAAAMLDSRPLLLIDHPALDGDREFRGRFADDWAGRLTARGTTVVMVSGDPELAAAADRHVRLVGGRVIDGTKAEETPQ